MLKVKLSGARHDHRMRPGSPGLRPAPWFMDVPLALDLLQRGAGTTWKSAAQQAGPSTQASGCALRSLEVRLSLSELPLSGQADRSRRRTDRRWLVVCTKHRPAACISGGAAQRPFACRGVEAIRQEVVHGLSRGRESERQRVRQKWPIEGFRMRLVPGPLRRCLLDDDGSAGR